MATNTLLVDSSFTINQVSGITTSGIGSATIALTLNHTGTLPKNVTLSTSVLPKGATATFTPAAGTTPFASVLTIDTKLTPAGTYSFMLNGYVDGTTSIGQSQNVSLVVNPTSTEDCNNFMFTAMAGKPIITKSSSNNSIYSTTKVLKKADGSLYFDDMMLDYSIHSVLERTSKDPVIFKVNCETGEIKIEEQKVGYTSVAYGSGTTDIMGTGIIDFTQGSYTVTYTTNYGSYILEGTIVL